MKQQREEQQKMQFRHAQAPALSTLGESAPQAPGGQPMQGQQAPQRAPMQRQPAEAGAQVETFVRDGRKVGRNEPCPCGSGKKYKRCHGALG